jgi:hypothetical protein
MALNYPGYSVPQPTDLTLLDVYGEWNKGVEKGKADRFEREAPEQFANAAAPLSEYGLSTPPDQLKAMFANPETRPMALQMVQEATQRRADASDPMKQLQLKKLQYDVAHQGDAPRNTVIDNANTRFKLGMANGLTDVAKLKADLDAGLITKDQYEAAAAKELQATGGLSVTTNADGTVSVQQGGPAGSGMPKLTEGQSKDVVYLTKGAGALPTLDQFGDSLTSLPETVGGNVPIVGNYAKSEGFQQAEQAGKEFLAAVLRKDTGAAVTASEEEMYGTMYLPRPGDKPAVLAQKKAARARALKAIELGIPSAAIVSMEAQGVELPGREPPPAEEGGWTDMGNGVRIREIK